MLLKIEVYCTVSGNFQGYQGLKLKFLFSTWKEGINLVVPQKQEWGLVRTDVANVTRSTEEIGFACIVIEIVDVAC